MSNTVIIADDITGANDIGIMYAKAGLDTVVYSYDKLGVQEAWTDEVTIIDTNSRFCTYEGAYSRVYSAVKLFHKHEVHQFIDKQCSVFRGNIGAEFDAMLDALEEEFAVVILGFPDNGRTTRHGIHYVHGSRLEESQFRNDPVHPMKQSDLVDILQAQTKRKVGAIFYEILDRGIEALSREIKEKKKECNYIILDVRHNEDLALIAEAVENEKIICGSSALGYYLGKRKSKGIRQSVQPSANETPDGRKILCIAGSLTPQTKAQLAHMKAKDYPVITLDTMKLFTEAELTREKSRILNEYHEACNKSKIVILHALNEEEQVKQTKALALQNGMDNTAISCLVSDTLAEIANIIAVQYSLKKFIICGGDTSASFCDRMKIKGMRICEEIEPGLPVCESITEPHYKLVLKSGSFGSAEFIEKTSDLLSR
ncbi:uncharacterized protein YgbK (DUF1537 family) [Anaerotaenia torta]|uniref:four-carbon acid sugar kinase family protein n=1 Tax=Anaerotaenia torta TaxID=433293 RepID=UPI003D19033D